MFYTGYRQDSYSGRCEEPYGYGQNTGWNADRANGQDRRAKQQNNGWNDDRANSQDRRAKRQNNEKNNDRANSQEKREKPKLKLKKGKKDGDTADVDGGVEAAPNGGVNAWVVCGGSAILTTANSVVRVSLHESIDSLNDEFDGIKNSSKCIEGVRADFDDIFGDDPASRDFANGCLYKEEDAYSCFMSNFFTTASGNLPNTTSPLYVTYNRCILKGEQNFFPCLYNNIPEFRDIPGYRLMTQHCSYLWNSSMWDLGNLTSPNNTGRLTAGNVFSASVSTENEESGTMLNYIFLAVSLFCVLLGAIISVFTGNRITAIIGSILVAIGFVVASFMGEDDEIVVQLLVGGVGGIGSAFLRISAIIAVLEYFQDLRMRAIVLSGMGAVLINFLMIGLTFVDAIDFEWKTMFRFQAIPAVLSLIASIFMKPLKLKSGNRGGQDDASCSSKCTDYVFSRDLFTDVIFYLIMFVFLLDQIGRPIFSEGMQPYLEEKKFSENQVKVQPLIENGGSLLGLITLLFWRRQNMADNLTVMAAMDILVGILALHVPELSIYAWAVAYSAIFGFTDGVFASMVQDSIPEGFERRHIRMVAGMLGLVAGIGLVISGFVADAIDKNSDGKQVAYYFSGGCLIGAGIFCVISRVMVVQRQIKAQERYRERDSIEFDDR